MAAVAIFTYFVLATVWFPSWVLCLPAVARAPRFVADLAGTAVWAVFLAVGTWGLRISQNRGWI
jgi:hypothetical protein